MPNILKITGQFSICKVICGQPLSYMLSIMKILALLTGLIIGCSMTSCKCANIDEYRGVLGEGGGE